MHNYLQTKLKSIDNVFDLIPFIKHLIPLNNIKIQLSAALHQELQKYNKSKDNSQEQNNSNSTIRSLFISSYSLSGIPSDDIHAKIISFLPSNEYKKLPMLSTHFRNIMKTHSYIYNKMGYILDISLQNSYWRRVIGFDFCVNHREKRFDIKAMEYIGDDDDMKEIPDSIPYEPKKIDFPFDKLNIWQISASFWGGGDNTNDVENYNKALVNKIIIPSKQCIQSMIFEQFEENYIEQPLLNKKVVFENCVCLKLSNSKLIPSIFNNIQCLDLSRTRFGLNEEEITAKANELMVDDPYNFKSQIDAMTNYENPLLSLYEMVCQSQEIAQIINEILNRFRDTLCCLVYDGENSGLLNHKQFKAKECLGVIKIPTNIEWIRIEQALCCIDLSECKKIIAIGISQKIRYDSIIWPKDYCIPYLYLSPCHQWDHQETWKQKLVGIKNDEVNAKFICFGKYGNASNGGWNNSVKIDYDNCEDERDVDGNDDDDEKKIEINDRGACLQRFTINEVRCDERYKKCKCLMLDASEINIDLFDKLIDYAFDSNMDFINGKKEIYKKWWSLNAGDWVRDIGNLTKLFQLNQSLQTW